METWTEIVCDDGQIGVDRNKNFVVVDVVEIDGHKGLLAPFAMQRVSLTPKQAREVAEYLVKNADLLELKQVEMDVITGKPDGE